MNALYIVICTVLGKNFGVSVRGLTCVLCAYYVPIKYTIWQKIHTESHRNI